MNLNLKVALLFFIINLSLYAQQSPGWYWVQFTDKNHSPYSFARPEEFLSARAIQRRTVQKISLTENDLPVSEFYCDSLAKLGIPVISRSKWFNAITTGYLDTMQVSILLQLDFVKKIKQNKPGISSKSTAAESGIKTFEDGLLFNYGMGYEQISMHNGHLLHNMGYTGKGVQIAIIDAGFSRANTVPAFQRLWSNNQILGYRDFVSPGSDVFSAHSHGTTVLSVIGSYLPGTLTGAAPDASFWLLRSEDVLSEYLIEEDNWVSAAEFADSAGADIINTSLGYTTFDDTSQNHAYEDMDGKTARVSVAANIAASKGMLLVTSAGNDGSTSWKYISAPADAENVLAVGATDFLGIIAYFSSRGPSADGRIKPDICAVGYNTYVMSHTGMLAQSRGTSLSAPIITGLSACLWQANRQATNMDIFNAILQSSNRFENPDSIYGYGIPDFYKANLILKANYRSAVDTTFTFNIFPNPFMYEFYLSAESDAETEAVLTVYNQTGGMVSKSVINFNSGYNLILIDVLSHLSSGVYFLNIRSGEVSSNTIVFKH